MEAWLTKEAKAICRSPLPSTVALLLVVVAATCDDAVDVEHWAEVLEPLVSADTLGEGYGASAVLERASMVVYMALRWLGSD